MQPPDQLDEDKADYCYECDRLIEVTSDHSADCPNGDDEHRGRYRGEPDYEQIIEDRARDRGPDPEAVMWGGEDIPS